MRDSVESITDEINLVEPTLGSARYSSKIEVPGPKRQNTLEVDNLLKRVRDREKPKPRLVSERPRKVQTIVLDEDYPNKVNLSAQPSQRLAAYQSNHDVEQRARNMSRNHDLTIGAGLIND